MAGVGWEMATPENLRRTIEKWPTSVPRQLRAREDNIWVDQTQKFNDETGN